MGNVIALIALIGFYLALLGGWIANTVAIFGSDFANFTVLLGFRLAGVVIFPLGSLLGFI